MFVDEVLCQDIFHVAGVEQRILNVVEGRVDFGIFDGFRHVFDTDHFAGLARNEVGDGTGSRIKVVHQFIPRQLGERAGYLV